MKLVLFVVSAVVIFAADSRDFPDKPDIGNFAVHHNQHIPSQQERKGEKELKLRGNAGKKNIKTLIKKLGSLDKKFTQAISGIKIELQAMKKRQGGVFIGGQYLTFSTEKLSWVLANSKCISLNGRLAVLANPKAVHTYIFANYHGQRFWLGASDRSREGTWTWINGRSLGNKHYDCGIFHLSSDYHKD